MTLLLGQNDDCLVLNSKDGKGRHRSQRYWAERGLIHVEDSKEGYAILSVAQFMQQVKALNDMLGRKSSSGDTGADASMRKEIQDKVDKACRIARKAQEQGMPDDPSCYKNYRALRKHTMYTGDIKSM